MSLLRLVAIIAFTLAAVFAYNAAHDLSSWPVLVCAGLALLAASDEGVWTRFHRP